MGRTCRSRVNVTKTILINFLTQGVFNAIHLPILIYGPCKIQKLSGRISIPVDCNDKNGYTLRLGCVIRFVQFTISHTSAL